jgi:TIR domain/SIR2-like domain
MQLFISYTRRDAEVVQGLVADLEHSGHQPWIDRDLTGGQQWWDEVLAEIRRCHVFVFALSTESAASKACRSEMAYAVACGRTILPVMVRDANVELAPDPIGATQYVEYRQRSSENAIALISALLAMPPAPLLPDPLPPPPSPPITDLAPIREALAADSLSLAQQQSLLEELSRRQDEPDQHDTLRGLLEVFRRRADVTVSIARAIDGLLVVVPSAEDDALDRPRQRRPLSERDPDTIDRMRALLTHARSGHFAPIIGHGLNDSIIGSPRAIAREWSRTFEFPMARYQQDALPDVAQFVAVMTNRDTLLESLSDYLRSHLAKVHPEAGQAGDGDLSEAMKAAWRAHRTETDPYLVLAKLPCAIYITATPWDLMCEALREAGRNPVAEVCRWRSDVYDWPASVFDNEPDYAPSAERPLVFHTFGALASPESLVLTQDDFDDFQIAVAENRAIIPTAVQRVLANSAITMLGFELEQRDVRVLLRSLIAQEGAQKLDKFTHVAAQLELGGGVVAPARAQRYMERYFAKFRQPSIDLFWGTVEEFSADMAELWAAGR